MNYESGYFDEAVLWFNMTDDEWRNAGCPVPGSVSYAIASAILRPDGGQSYRALMGKLQIVNREVQHKDE